MDSPGENSGGDVPTQGWNPGVPRRRQTPPGGRGPRHGALGPPGGRKRSRLAGGSHPAPRWLETARLRLSWGLPWWLSGREPTCQCRRPGFHPWVRKVPSSVLAWEGPWTEEPGGLQPRDHRVGHDCALNDSKSPKGQSTNINSPQDRCQPALWGETGLCASHPWEAPILTRAASPAWCLCLGLSRGGLQWPLMALFSKCYDPGEVRVETWGK